VTATLLPLPDDPRIPALIELWPEIERQYANAHPRSFWLGGFEQILRENYPAANSASRKLTARHYAPFQLAAGHDVP